MILIVGNINYDILLPLDRLPDSHEKMLCPDAHMGFGGSAANTAWWLAKMGVPVKLAGSVGDDVPGKAHIQVLEKAGVDVSGIDRVDNAATGITVIFSLGGEKRMIRSLGANLVGTVHPELIEGCDLVYLSGTDADTLTGYANAAADIDLRVISGCHGKVGKDVLGSVGGVILNRDEVIEMTGVEDPEDGIRALDTWLAAVTLPEGGCLVSEGIDVHKVPAPELEPVDRTGGGDAFAAGFLAGMAKGLDIEQCGKWGNELAAAVIMQSGARPAITIENPGLSIAD